MFIKVSYNLSQSDIYKMKDVRLTKSIKSEIKEKIIDKLEYKNLSDICQIRGAEIKRMTSKEVNKYFDTYNFISKDDIEQIEL